MSYSRHKETLNWLSLQTRINERFADGTKPTYAYRRGAIVTVLLGENVGYEKSGGINGRPCLVVSSDTNNIRNGNVTVVPLTDEANKAGRKLLPTQYRLDRHVYSFLRLSSIVQCEDIRTVSKARIHRTLGHLHAQDLRQIERRLRTLLEL